MLKLHFFHQSFELPNQSHHHVTSLRYVIHPTQAFSAEGVYTWVLEPSKIRSFIYIALLMVFAIFATCFRAWPLSMKIALWWLCVGLLASIFFIIIIRLVAYPFFWLSGQRDVWLLPNLFEDLGPLESFTPFVGHSITWEKEQRELARQKEKEKERKEAGDSEDADSTPEGYSLTKAIVNMIGLVVLGFVACYLLGLFSSEFIPNFFISRDELIRGRMIANTTATSANATAPEPLSSPSSPDDMSDVVEDVPETSKAATDSQQHSHQDTDRDENPTHSSGKTRVPPEEDK